MSDSAACKYGSMGKIGIGTPQANPTVEAEMAILLPRACSLHVTRLTSRADSAEARLRQYLLELERHLAAYDTLRLDVFGFACTGSSYLLGAKEEDRLVAAAQDRVGYPVETAARAMVWSLKRLHARRIALVAPYPPGLIEAASRYWAQAGVEIVRTHRIPTRTADTRGIYELTSQQLAEVLRALPLDGTDAVLVSGTGLPSLPALRHRGDGIPAISSNMCLAARLLDLLGRSDWLDPRAPLVRDWEHRLDEALANP
jgi:maleate isomerase